MLQQRIDPRQLPEADTDWALLRRRIASGRKPRVVLIGNPDKPATSGAIARLRASLDNRAEVAAVDLSPSVQTARDTPDVDFYIVIGGDGTLLGASRALLQRQAPMVGVHLGHLGFLTAFTEDEFPRHLNDLLTGRLPVSRRSTLECCVSRNPANRTNPPADAPADCAQDFSSFAINDCVITAGPPFKIIRMALRINGQPMVEVAGDGLIIATPGGSTAYNLSAGGPLLGPTVRAMVVTPLNPHSITHKPAVVDAASVVEVIAERVNAGTTCLLDGQITTPIRDGDRIMIQLGANELLLARHPHVGEWQFLQDRLHWGRMPVVRETRGGSD